MANQLIKLLAIFIISLTGLAMPIGCASTDGRITAEKRIEPAVHQESARSHIIIKFNNNTIDPLRPGFLESLSRDAGATISYLRPMSGNAHVFSIDVIATGSSINTIIRKLSGRADVSYVEQDLIMKHR